MPNVKPRFRWESRAVDASSLDGAFPPVVARVLATYGLHRAEDADAFLSPHTLPLSEIGDLEPVAKAVARLKHAIAHRQRVLVYGDYDVDGVTSVVQFAKFLHGFGVPVRWRVPDRQREGYGVSRGAINELAPILRQTDLLITVDCGTPSSVELAQAMEYGCEVIVIDHHLGQERWPDVLAVVNPHHPDIDYADAQHLCASGLVFHVIRELCDDPEVAARFVGDIDAYRAEAIGLAALGTVADVAPMRGSNRALVARGLRSIQRGGYGVGLSYLMEAAGVAPSAVDPRAIGWRIGPRINAAGRMDHAQIAIALLLSSDQPTTALLAQRIETLHARRQEETDTLIREVREQVMAQDPLGAVVVVAGEGWSASLVGLAAGRVVGDTGRPAVVLGIKEGVGRGSARSRPDFDISSAIGSCRDILLTFGGHHQAAGLSIRDFHIPAFAARLDEYARAVWGGPPPPLPLTVATEATIPELTQATVGYLANLAPFGHGYEEPRLLIRDVEVLDARAIGGDKRTLRLTVSDGENAIGAVGFGGVQSWPTLGAGDRVDLVVNARVDEKWGKNGVDLHIEDMGESHG